MVSAHAESNEPAAPVRGRRVRSIAARHLLRRPRTSRAGRVSPAAARLCGEIEEKLSAIVRTPVLLTVAGRTDAGVHASGQVAHVDVPADMIPEEPSRLVRRLARFLPRDVRVKPFHSPRSISTHGSRRSRRHYEYRLTTAPYGAEPLRARDTVAWPKDVDVDAMREASSRLLGLHDFAAFCKRPRGCDDGSRTAALRLGAVGSRTHCLRERGRLLLVDGAESGRCRARGRRGPPHSRVDGGLLAERVRASAVAVAPAHGLSLTASTTRPTRTSPPSNEATRRCVVRSIRAAPAVAATDVRQPRELAGDDESLKSDWCPRRSG